MRGECMNCFGPERPWSDWVSIYGDLFRILTEEELRGLKAAIDATLDSNAHEVETAD